MKRYQWQQNTFKTPNTQKQQLLLVAQKSRTERPMPKQPNNPYFENLGFECTKGETCVSAMQQSCTDGSQHHLAELGCISLNLQTSKPRAQQRQQLLVVEASPPCSRGCQMALIEPRLKFRRSQCFALTPVPSMSTHALLITFLRRPCSIF